MGKLDTYNNPNSLLNASRIKSYCQERNTQLRGIGFLTELESFVKQILDESIEMTKSKRQSTRPSKTFDLKRHNLLSVKTKLSFDIVQDYLNQLNYKIPNGEQEMTPRPTNN